MSSSQLSQELLLKYANVFFAIYSQFAPQEIGGSVDDLTVLVCKYFGVRLDELGIRENTVHKESSWLRDETMSSVCGAIIETKNGRVANLKSPLQREIFAKYMSKKEAIDKAYVEHGFIHLGGETVKLYYFCLVHHVMNKFEQVMREDKSIDEAGRDELKRTIVQSSLLQQLIFVNNKHAETGYFLDFSNNLAANVQRISQMSQQKFNELVLTSRADREHDNKLAQSSSSSTSSASFFEQEPSKSSGGRIFSASSLFRCFSP